MKKKVIIYCAFGYGERVAYALDDERYEIIGFSDSNEETWDKCLYGGYVYPPYKLKELSFDYLIISVSVHADAIKKDLLNKYHIEENKIIVYNPDYNDIVWEEERTIELRKCISMLKERNIHGNMAEVGVYKGDFAKLFNRYFPERKLYLFDTFEGFDAEKNVVFDEGDLTLFKDTSVELVLSKMATPENCIVRKGFFPETAKDIDDEFCLVSLDADLYEPILDGLNYFYPRLVKGGYIFIHDFGSYHYKGVKTAVYEFCEKNNVAIYPLCDRCLSVIISK